MSTTTIRTCDKCGTTPTGSHVWSTLTNERTTRTEDVCMACVAKLNGWDNPVVSGSGQRRLRELIAERKGA